MKLFQNNGHLTDEAIRALTRGEDLDELTRLEMAEHLSFCDECLERYTAALENAPLFSPQGRCTQGVWRRIRARAVRLLTTRYAAAAASVAVALILVWGTPPVERAPLPPRSTVTERLEQLPQRWSRSLDGLSEHFGTFLDGFDRPDQNGGNRS